MVYVSHCEEAVVAAEDPKVVLVEDVVVEEVAPETKEIKVETAPLDPRFPATNQSHHCFVKYNEAHKCFKEKGEDNAECKRLAHAYRSICPSQWIEEWSALREEGKWFGKY